VSPKFVTLLLSNLKYGVISHLMVLIFGIVRALVIPGLLGVTDFGFWQLYLLYAGFVGIFTFGFNDGIYLRYGGKRADELPWKRLRGAFWLYFITLCFISFALLIILSNIDVSSEKAISFRYVIFSVGLTGVGSLYIFLFQTTNQIKKYSIYILIDKILFVLMLSLFYFYYSDYNFEFLMVIDCISKLLLIAIMTINCRDYIFGSMASALVCWKEFYANIGVGITLMLANLSAMMMINMSRFFVERYYPIEEFSVFSFGLTLVNLGLMLTIGVSTVLYPALKKITEEKYQKLYLELTDATTMILFILLFTYYPINYFVLNFLTDFKDVLEYLNILLVLSLLQIKLNLTLNLFYKVLRKEQSLLKANLTSIVLIFSLSILIVLFHRTIEAMALATLVTLIFRVYSSDYYIKNILKCQNHCRSVFEFSVLMIFILITKNMTLNMSFLLLLIFFLSFVYRQKIQILTWVNILKGSR
jgi:O-antigen/teichoic acid export membrane protein